MFAQLPGVQSALTALSADDPHEIGGYRLHARLGSGGMGVVYLAYTPGGRHIALKAVRREFATDPEFRERFAQEVASARRIHGLFTAQVVDSGEDDRTPWLATAYVPGPSLHQVVQRHGPLPVRTVLLLIAGIAEALQEIHRAGVVHRDLKPANVLVAGDGPRVIDFGIARAADAAALTGVGLRIGTAAFMAPEQALGHPVTPATDVFALGALAGFVAGGVPPFGNGPESGALYRVVHEHPDLGRIPPRAARPAVVVPGQVSAGPSHDRRPDRGRPRAPPRRSAAGVHRRLAAPAGAGGGRGPDGRRPGRGVRGVRPVRRPRPAGAAAWPSPSCPDRTGARSAAGARSSCPATPTTTRRTVR
ncbi:serine/threonine-protein kinase [Streptomyces sp. NPDC001549]|uniref:serine/threonine-protein kinase n=1 Tax=Streptomyces sp. NPDC001549 TaxID=3364586 RepID=UPI0036904C1F